MNHAHYHTAQHSITRLILDVLPARAAVISFCLGSVKYLQSLCLR
jgi:hypothetical protein